MLKTYILYMTLVVNGHPVIHEGGTFSGMRAVHACEVRGQGWLRYQREIAKEQPSLNWHASYRCVKVA